ncbi:sigma-70 family RNA polymerase sigma factor [Reichenbachiella agarivorans]|uniref:Sigma-70 family RNA polymerase sigma factor n=1 Tax=Reichenbachiella agarivorans TaxID=2979464 RepID=A0ABY6CVK8_9BACT|nr:sigma-70 family RNA polymerase sigma factor [Reichenbachiella agarivorans]UXP33433.1 sigma-70 family RNA polymerase sigma factor [Reichenbachiella agarivorans]
MLHTEVISYRPFLIAVAFKMVGCRSTAEDLVQDTFLSWLKVDASKIQDVKSYLTRTVTNKCLNYLKSIKQKKEELIDQVSPSLTSLSISPDFSNLDLKCEVTHALSLVFKKLAPSERAVFVLKELFNFDYSDLTTILGKKADNCRQILSRAQSKLSDETERFSVDVDKLRRTVIDFKNATLGEFSGLIDNLKSDIYKKGL